MARRSRLATIVVTAIVTTIFVSIMDLSVTDLRASFGGALGSGHEGGVAAVARPVPVTSTGSRKPHFDLAVGILSRNDAKGAEARKAVRDTSLRLLSTVTGSTNFSATHIFVLSEPTDEATIAALKAENETYGDIHWLPAEGKDLFRKVWYFFAWAAVRYEVTWLLKTDDDAFINYPLMAEELVTKQPRTQLYWGRRGGAGGPWKNNCGSVLRGYLEGDCPWYMAGLGYVVSQDLANLIGTLPFDVLKDCYDATRKETMEDICVGLHLLPYKATHVDDRRFHNIDHNPWAGELTGAWNTKDTLVAHHVPADVMRTQFKNLYPHLH